MWRVTVLANALIMILFWLASLLSVALAYNRYVQYPEADGSMALPSSTELALSLQYWAGLLPLAWIVLSYVLWQRLKETAPDVRSEYLLAFSSITVIAGFAMLIFFALAGTMPFLFICALID